MSAKYAVYPGYVTSRNDGQRHYIGFEKLCHLYGVPTKECVNMSDEASWRGRDRSGYISLTPRRDGNYQLPTP